MLSLRRTKDFNKWMASLKDRRTRLKIEERIDRLSFGNAGLHRYLGAGVSELKIDWGPGYRVYFMQQGEELIVLLCGGDKKSQQRDIERASLLATAWKETSDGA